MSHEHHLTVRRTARYYTLGDEHGAPRELWVVCHGYGQLAARFLRHFAVLDDGSRVVAAPEALSRFYTTPAHDRIGASWMTREDRLSEIDNYVSYLDAVYDDVTRRIGHGALPCIALGFSQGAATATRWATTGSTAVARLILWASQLPADADLVRDRDRLARLQVTLVVGGDDHLVAAADVERDEARLRELGGRVELIRFDGGHGLNADVLTRIAR